MNRAAIAASAVALIAAAGGAFVAGGAKRPSAFTPVIVSPAAADDVTPAYYQDPDGKPLYSPTPTKTPDGRDYVPVMQDAELPTENKPDSKPATAARADRKVKYYRNPMGLPDTSPVPKKDSMGMDYIAVFEGDDTDDGAVKLTPGKIQRTGAKAEPATRRIIRTTVRAPGIIQLDERRISVISMRAESWVQKVADVTTGTKVKKGQPLMEIYSPAIASAAAEYIATITSKVTAGENQYGRGARQRVMNLDVPETALAAMEKSRTVPLTIAWTAPRDGIVLERNATEGMRAQPGDVLFRVADTSVVWALVDVAERDLGAVAVGQLVTVKARSFPDREFSGTIVVVYPQVNRDTRTARVRIELANSDLALLQDMYVDAAIETGNPSAVLAVPESAVLDTGNRQAVLVEKSEGRFEPRDVKLGRRGGGYVEIRDGLKDNEPVVVSANFLIDAESNLKASLKGFSDAGDKP